MATKMKTLTINDVTYDITDDSAVSFVEEQELTEAQKARARENIGSIGETDINYLKIYVTPQMYGAVGDGVSDDTTAIKNAIQECNNASKALFVPTGIYNLTDVLSFNNIEVVGLNSEKCILKMTGQTTSREHFISCGGKVSIKNIGFTQSIDGAMFGMFGCNDSVIENCTFLVEEGVASNGYVDLYQSNNNIRITNCRFLNYSRADIGGVWVRNAEDTISKNIIFDKCIFEHKTKDEVIAVWGWFGTVQDVVFRDCSFETLDEEYSPIHMLSFGMTGVTKNVTMEHCVIKNNTAVQRTIKSSVDTETDITDNIRLNNCHLYIEGTALDDGLSAFGNNIIFTDCNIVMNRAQNLSERNTFNRCKIDIFNGNFIRRNTLVNDCEIICRKATTLAFSEATFNGCIIDFCNVKSSQFLFQPLEGSMIKMDGCKWKNCAGFDKHMSYHELSNFTFEFNNCKGITGVIYNNATNFTFKAIGNELSSLEIWGNNYTGHIYNNFINGVFVSSQWSNRNTTVPIPDVTIDEGKFLSSVAGVPTWVALPSVE